MAIYLPKGEIVPVPPAGQVALAVDAGGNLVMRDIGGAAVTVALAGSAAHTALARAQSVLGPTLGATITKVFGTDFDTSSWIATPTLAGSGAAALSTTERGGVMNMSTGATGSSSVIIKPFGAAGLVINPTTDVWYMRSRFRQAAAMDANTYNSVGIQGTSDAVLFGAIGTRSTTTFAYEVYNNAAAVQSSGSLVVTYDQLFHIFEAWGDTVNFYIAVDGTIRATVPIPATTTNPCAPQLFVSNGATAANRAQNVDDVYICTAAA